MNKIAILNIISTIVDSWSETLPFACGKGCHVCCTTNVTITAIEGEKILRYAVDQGLEQWLAERLAALAPQPPPQHTLNDFAAACLSGEDVREDPFTDTAPCPFLVDGCCRIYPVRPLACRLFASTETCRPSHPATVPQWYFDAATAVTQIVEHLGQKEYWGRMQDVVLALLDIRLFTAIAARLDPILIIRARLGTLSAKPLPGFLFSEDAEGRVSGIINRLLETKVEGKRLDDLLNGH